MGLGKIWERYLIREMLKTFLLILLTFFGLYVLIDYSSHTATMLRPSGTDILIYYAADFSRRIDVIVPFALLISAFRVVYQLNASHEMIALLTSGISKRRILIPLAFVGFLFVGAGYLNHQYLLPYAHQAQKCLGEEFLQHHHAAEPLPVINHLMLLDGTTILYHRYDELHHQLSDVYWIRNAHHIWKIKTLDLDPDAPIGHSAELIVRDPASQHLVVENRWETKHFNNMRFNKRRLFNTLASPDELSISKLFDEIRRSDGGRSEKSSHRITSLYQKLAYPWLALIAILAPLPFCMRSTRTLSPFLLFTCSIFGLVAFYLLMDAASVLSKRQVINPFFAVGIPFSLAWLFIGTRILRLK